VLYLGAGFGMTPRVCIYLVKSDRRQFSVPGAASLVLTQPWGPARTKAPQDEPMQNGGAIVLAKKTRVRQHFDLPT